MKTLNRVPLSFLALVLLCLGGCGETDGLEGRYRAAFQDKTQLQVITLELGRTGQGTWKTGGDQVSFKWEIRGTEIRLHTREGGVLPGRVGNNTIDLQLPGMPSLTFSKIVR
jgi:hypothetical protein